MSYTFIVSIMLKKLLLFIVFIFLGLKASMAQDPQFSQFYAAPLYLNPAFTGSNEKTRVGLNFRSQWPSLNASFSTASVYMDHFFEDYYSGVGLMITGDQESLSGMQSLSVSGLYAFQLRITDKLTFRPGFSVGFMNRRVNFGNLVFPDQVTDNGITPETIENLNAPGSKIFLDLSTGGILYNDNFFLGFSAHHINRPNQSILAEQSILPIKYSVHGGYKFLLPTGFRQYGNDNKGRERSITPAMNYKRQGPFDQLDIGLYLTYEPIVFGLWYRGLPVKQIDGFSNNESVIFLVGMSRGSLNIGYSFDYTISGLGIGSGGAHEVSLSYDLDLTPNRPPRNVRKIPCPKF